MVKPNCLTIAGSDPSCGAGLQLDIRVFNELGVKPLSVVSVVTAQSGSGVDGSSPLPRKLVADQLNSLLDSSVSPRFFKAKAQNGGAVKLGVQSEESIKAILDTQILECPYAVVLDPIIRSSSGYQFIDPSSLCQLFPLVTLVTPNLIELGEYVEAPLTNSDEIIRAGLSFLKEFSCQNVLVKGGHGNAPSRDILFSSDGQIRIFEGETIEAPGEVRGTGCFLSAAIAAHLALGLELSAAIAAAKSSLELALRSIVQVGDGKRFEFDF